MEVEVAEIGLQKVNLDLFNSQKEYVAKFYNS